jgi:hypothetical protein
MLCSMTRSPMLKQIDFAFLVIGTLVRLAVIGAFEIPLASLRYAFRAGGEVFVMKTLLRFDCCYQRVFKNLSPL